MAELLASVRQSCSLLEEARPALRATIGASEHFQTLTRVLLRTDPLEAARPAPADLP